MAFKIKDSGKRRTETDFNDDRIIVHSSIDIFKLHVESGHTRHIFVAAGIYLCDYNNNGADGSSLWVQSINN